MDAHEDPGKEASRQDQLKPYLKYSGLAFQMIVTLVAAAYAGQWLDEKQGNKNPWWTIAFMVVAVIGTMYMVIKSVTAKQ
jgi:F0F1-type ATP synthase assembly protein I